MKRWAAANRTTAGWREEEGEEEGTSAASEELRCSCFPLVPRGDGEGVVEKEYENAGVSTWELRS